MNGVRSTLHHARSFTVHDLEARHLPHSANHEASQGDRGDGGRFARTSSHLSLFGRMVADMARPRRSKLEVQGDKILKAAREAGAEESYFFETTFARYRRQLKLLAELDAVLDDGEVLVTKEYVRGRERVRESGDRAVQRDGRRGEPDHGGAAARRRRLQAGRRRQAQGRRAAGLHHAVADRPCHSGAL